MTGLALRLENADDFVVERRPDDQGWRHRANSASAGADQRSNDTSSEEEPTHEWMIQREIARRYSPCIAVANPIRLASLDGTIPATTAATNVINRESAMRRTGA